METADFEFLFYSKQIEKFEHKKKLSSDDLIMCQQMLQVIDNNKNYFPKQHQAMLKIDAYNKLSNILKQHGIKRLGKFKEPIHEQPKFDDKEICLDAFLTDLISKINNSKKCGKKPAFLQNLIDYTKWGVKNDKKTSYVFLLRDMLLSYLYSTIKLGNSNAYPLLFGRKMLNYFYLNTSKDNFDFDFSDSDEIYMQFLETIFDSASKTNSFDSFFSEIKPKFMKIIKANKEFYVFIKNWLKTIKTEKIIVIESGRYATIPLILKCVDDRVDFKLFSTSPEFYGIYKNKVFVKNLDKMIEIEKSLSQNELFVFSSIKDGKIMIKQNANDKVKQESIKEIMAVVN